MSVNRIIRINARILLIIGIVFSSCISQNKVKLIQERTTKTPTTDFPNSKVTTYRLQTGDHLYIEVYSVDPKTSKFFQTDFPDLMNPTYLYLKSYSVDEFGFINFSFIDKMYVKGLTVVEVKDLLQKTLNDYFKESTVVIKLVNFEVSVIGEVNDPGSFTIYRDQINIFQAIGLAGGFKDFGNPKKVKLVRQVPTGSNLVELDLSDNKILESQYFYMQPNDVLYIEPLNAKSVAYQRFPYELLLVIISTATLVYSVFIE
ncbi:MAG: polysaccharide biosynthesis/export family protein [Bacteroidales bacterium]|nr:polysaccharide biosynthesis/export family protein [Bacteroidales bacterium]MBN2763427.1 polysaccharide biosynthesis/export family protein [Bacteroidales bacterium]